MNRVESQEHTRILQFLTSRTGLAFDGAQRQSALQAIERSMSHCGVNSSRQYLSSVTLNRELLDSLISEVTVGETYFFRNSEQFTSIRREIIPQLRRRVSDGKYIRVWSAGCASGEEAYSLAILFDQAGLGERSRILGTDISRKALKAAREAIYGDWALRGNGTTMIAPYIDFEPEGYRIQQHLRERATFVHLNLAEDGYPDPATRLTDLILCRNVLIYFGRETIRSVAARLFECLAEGGWLVTGAGDPPLDDFAPFEAVTTDSGICYRRCSPTERSSASVPTDAANLRKNPFSSTSPPRNGSVSPSRSADDEKNDSAAAAAPLASETLAANRVRSLASAQPDAAETLCRELLVENPLSCELQYLHAILLLELGQLSEAVKAGKRVIYLDRKLAQAHFTLGAIHERAGDIASAVRCFRNARDLGCAAPADQPVPLSDGEDYSGLLKAVTLKLDQLGS